jgi:putative ABC transport system permease protein
MMLGVAIGIAALTIIVAVGQGAKAQVLQRIDKMLSTSPIVVSAGEGGIQRGSQIDVTNSTLTPEDATAIAEEIPGVREVALVQRMPGVVLTTRAQTTSAQVFGVTPNWHDLQNWEVADGEELTAEDNSGAARVCLVGRTVAQALFGEADPVGETLRIREVSLRVKGVLVSKGVSPGGGDLDNRLVVPLATFSRRLYNVTALAQVIVRPDNMERIDSVVAAISALLRERHHIVPPKQDDFSVRTPEAIVHFAAGTSQTLSLFLGVVAGIALLVGGLVIMNIMLVSVGERTREIGIRRAVGARRKDILRQFLAEAVAVTLSGGLVGVLVGVASAAALSALKDMPMQVSWQAVAVAVVFSVLVGIIFGVYPAKRAARLHPVEALRTE